MGHPGNSLSRSQHDGETQSVFYKFKYDFSSSPHCRVEPEFRCLIPPCQEMIVIAAYFSPPVLVVCLRVFLNHRCVYVVTLWVTHSLNRICFLLDKQTNKQTNNKVSGRRSRRAEWSPGQGWGHSLAIRYQRPLWHHKRLFFFLLWTVKLSAFFCMWNLWKTPPHWDTEYSISSPWTLKWEWCSSDHDTSPAITLCDLVTQRSACQPLKSLACLQLVTSSFVVCHLKETRQQRPETALSRSWSSSLAEDTMTYCHCCRQVAF